MQEMQYQLSSLRSFQKIKSVQKKSSSVYVSFFLLAILKSKRDYRPTSTFSIYKAIPIFKIFVRWLEISSVLNRQQRSFEEASPQFRCDIYIFLSHPFSTEQSYTVYIITPIHLRFFYHLVISRRYKSANSSLITLLMVPYISAEVSLQIRHAICT